MDKELKQKWVEALRSGNYRQGKEFLKIKRNEGYEYCCLGVLCDILNAPYKESNSGVCSFLNATGYNGEVRKGLNLESSKEEPAYSGGLPDDICKLTGLSPLGTLPRPINKEDVIYGYVSLAGMNDKGCTFEQIADVIEEQF